MRLKLLWKLLKAGLLAVLIGGVGIILWYWFQLTSKPPVLQAFINANVITMKANNARAEAVLVANDRIIAVGTNKEVTALVQQHKARSGVRVHDLAGKTLMPGFIEAHGHFPNSGVYEFAADLNAPPIGEVKTIGELQHRLRKADSQLEPNAWLFGLGYDDTQMVNSRHPLRRELDAVSTSRPIFILHISGHMGVANSAALRALGINAASKAPKGGAYQKNTQGQLTGLILEKAIFPFLSSATDYSLRQISAVLKSASQEYAAVGVTTVQNGLATNRDIQGLRWASKLKLLPQRVVLWPDHESVQMADLPTMRANNTDYYTVGAIKIVVDGSIQGYTAYLSKPYHKPPANNLAFHATHQAESKPRKAYTGSPIITKEALVSLLKKLVNQGYNLAIHGNGDGAIDDILFAIEQVQRENPQTDPRTVLVHAQMARYDQLEKMRALGVTPSFFSAHTYYWGDRHKEIFMGPNRANKMSPARSAQRLDLPFSIHLDTPVVPMQPMRLLWSAVYRKSSSDRVIGRTERISREQALRAITIDAAYQVFKEKDIGSIEVGKFADLIVLNADPTDENEDLLGITVLKTMVGGFEIYSAAQ